MKNNILASALIVLLLGIALGGATLALFNDEEVSADNHFETGTLDLKLDWVETYNGEVIEEQELTNKPGSIFELKDIKPGDKGEGKVSIHLEGNTGWVWMNLNQTANKNLHCTEPQRKALDIPYGEDCPDEGNLADYLEFTIWSGDSSNVIFEGTAAELEEQGIAEGLLLDGDASTEEAEPFEGDTTSYIGIEWELPIETGNEVQGDLKKYDLSFYTEQRRHNDNPENPYKSEDPVDEKPDDKDPKENETEKPDDKDPKENETEVNYTQTNWQVDLVDGDVIEDLSEQSYSDRDSLEYANHGFTDGEGPQFEPGYENRANQVDYMVNDSTEVEVTGGPEDPTATVNFEISYCCGKEATFVSYENTGEIGWSGGQNQVLYDYETVTLTNESDTHQEIEVDLPAAAVAEEETEEENGTDEENGDEAENGDESDESDEEETETSGSLTFNDQEIQDNNEVTINNVSTTHDTTVHVTYQDSEGDTITAGTHNAPADLDNFDPMTLEIDESGVPGEYTARMIEKPIAYGYNPGDALHEDTLDREYFSQSAYITEAEENGEEVSDEGNQFYTDFSDYTEGVSLFDEDWTRQLGANEYFDLTVMQLGSEYIADFVRPEDSDRNAATWDVVSDTDGEIEAFAEWQNTDEASGDMRPSILLHGSGDSAEETEGVRFENRPNGNEFNIAEYVDGEWSGELATESFEYTEDEYYKLRAWTNGTHSEMTVWERGQDEEDGVTIATDETTIESGDFNGIFEWQDDATQYPFTEIGFGTEGETAPSSE